MPSPFTYPSTRTSPWMMRGRPSYVGLVDGGGVKRSVPDAVRAVGESRGAALLWEKIVATNSNKIVWIVDESKVVDTIGKFPLPVEVIPFGAGHVIKQFEAKSYKPVLRLDADGKEVRTDENNFVVDLHLERIDHPQDLAEDLINTVGVVEHGLFLNMVDKVIVGDPNGPRVMTNGNK